LRIAVKSEEMPRLNGLGFLGVIAAFMETATGADLVLSLLNETI
jgi:hypothetical protein